MNQLKWQPHTIWPVGRVVHYEDASMSDESSATTRLLYKEWMYFKKTKMMQLTLMQYSSELNFINIQWRNVIFIFVG